MFLFLQTNYLIIQDYIKLYQQIVWDFVRERDKYKS